MKLSGLKELDPAGDSPSGRSWGDSLVRDCLSNDLSRSSPHLGFPRACSLCDRELDPVLLSYENDKPAIRPDQKALRAKLMLWVPRSSQPRGQCSFRVEEPVHPHHLLSDQT